MHSVTLTVLVEPEFKKACRIAAATQNLSLSEWVRGVLQKQVSFFEMDVHQDAQDKAS